MNWGQKEVKLSRKDQRQVSRMLKSAQDHLKHLKELLEDPSDEEEPEAAASGKSLPQNDVLEILNSLYSTGDHLVILKY